MIRNDGQRLVEKPPTPGLRFEDLHLRDPEGGRLGVGLQTFAADDNGGSRTFDRQNIRSYDAKQPLGFLNLCRPSQEFIF